VNIRSALQPVAHLAGAAFRVLPKSKRFGAARRIAFAIAPVLRRTRYFQRRPSLLDGPREEALRIVLRTMTRAGVEFDPELEIRGRELVANGSAMIVSGHFLLNIAMSRWIFESGHRFTVGLGGPREPIFYFGTRAPLHHCFAGPQMFVQLRDAIRNGDSAFLTIEVAEPEEGLVGFDTVAGRRYLSPAAFAFALRTHTPVVFAATYLNREGRLQVTYEAPSSTDAEGITAEFCEFLQRHVAQVAR
jgi:hypothetical protein